jgi:hypothetical protein
MLIILDKQNGVRVIKEKDENLKLLDINGIFILCQILYNCIVRTKPRNTYKTCKFIVA